MLHAHDDDDEIDDDDDDAIPAFFLQIDLLNNTMCLQYSLGRRDNTTKGQERVCMTVYI